MIGQIGNLVQKMELPDCTQNSRTFSVDGLFILLISFGLIKFLDSVHRHSHYYILVKLHFSLVKTTTNPTNNN